MSGRAGRTELGMLGQGGLAGLGDIQDPLAQRILPGSLRRRPPSLIEGGPAAPPAGVAGGDAASAILAAFAALKGAHGGFPVAEVPCGAWQVNSYLLGVTAAVLVDEPLRRNRRIVWITNTDPLNDVWVGPDSTTRVNLGEKIPPLSARGFPFTELVRIYATSNGAGTIVSVSQVAT